MPSRVAAELIKLVPLLLEVLIEALKADDPKEALITARAAARMAAIEKARGAAVRRTR